MNLNKQKFVCKLKSSWKESFTQYSSADYTLTLSFVNGSSKVSAAVTANDDGSFGCVLDLSLQANQSLPNGDYDYQVIISNADGVQYVDSGKVVFLPNVAAGQTDSSFWAVTLENLKAAYQRLSSREAKEVILYDGTRVNYEDRDKILVEIRNAETRLSIARGDIQKANQTYKLRYK